MLHQAEMRVRSGQSASGREANSDRERSIDRPGWQTAAALDCNFSINFIFSWLQG